MYLHYILKDCQLSDTVSTTISKVDVFTISFQLTCKFIHTSYDNTTLANASFMSIFYLFRLYTILLHCCGIQLVQLKYRLLFMRSFSSLISKFQFHLLSNTSEGGKSKAICPLSTKYTFPFYGEGDTFGAKM